MSTEASNPVLPQRRNGDRVEIVFLLGSEEKKATAQFNFFPDGTLCEIFCRPFKSGMDMEALLDRFCIVTSIALRRGVRIEEIAKVTGDTVGSERADIFGTLLREGIKAEGHRIAALLGAATC